MSTDPKIEITMESALAEARESIKKIEGTTGRICDIIAENKPREDMRRRADYHVFSAKFVTLVVVSSLVISVLFGTAFYLYATATEHNVQSLTSRVNTLEATICATAPSRD